MTFLSPLFWLVMITFVLLPGLTVGQTVSPTSISVTGGPVCSGGNQDFPVQITLPPGAVVDKVDVFLLFDDTGSFAGFVPTVSTIFSGLVTALEAALPGVSFGFGVGRFEDYGGPGTGFSGEVTTGRPSILNQPIVTAATAGGVAARNALITAALGRTAPGFGGDGPESAIAEGLFQVATGAGFDGNGDGSSLNSGVAGAIATQTTPGTSGDVPPFSSNVATTSGTLGGVGFRSGALHLVLLATDICAVSTFPAGSPIPATITGAGGSSEPVSAFACASTTPGSGRFGFVSNSKTLAGNTVAGAVAPAGAATVQGTVTALNALGIRVLGMGPGAAPTTSPGPSFAPSVWLSAMARLTGAVNAIGTALVFSTSVPLATLSAAIVAAITTTVTLPVDITLSTTALPSGLSFGFAPPVVPGVAPGGTAPFVVTFTGSGAAIAGGFDINFVDVGSSAVLGSIPVTVACAVVSGVCPHTQGHWRRKPGEWPVTSLTLGSVLYSQAQLLDILEMKLEGDASRHLAKNLISAKLSVANGSDAAPIAAAIADADALIGGNSIPMNVPKNTPLGQSMMALSEVLDDYIHSVLTPGCINSSIQLTDANTEAEVVAEVPTGYRLDQNFPNPFNPETHINYSLPEAVHARLVVYDVLGREVRVLVDQQQGPGYYVVVWDGKDLNGSPVTSGVYFYRLSAGAFSSIQKMVLMR